MTENPYATPASKVADVTPEDDRTLSDRGNRLLAAIVDGLILAPVSFTYAFGVVLKSQVAPGLIAFAFLWLLAVLAVDLYLLDKNGQTIGKKLLSIKIVRKDGSRAGLARIFWLRGAIGVLIGFIPVVGGLYGLVDVLFIFGEPRRCVHDYIADTIVVNA